MAGASVRKVCNDGYVGSLKAFYGESSRVVGRHLVNHGDDRDL
jgi:hypothetical protein